MKIKEIVKILELFAPLPLQESYDNSGLQVGLTDAETSRVLFCLDVTEEVIHYAISQECNLIIAHHPLLFRGVKRVGEDTQVERCLRLAIKHDITLYAAHTNLDNAENGVSFQMGEKLGLKNLSFLRPNDLSVPLSGSGAIGDLSEAMPIKDFISLVGRTFQAENIQFSQSEKDIVKKVALCGGAGDFLIADALYKEADVFITGEIGYHLFFGHEKEISLLAIGHYESERYVPELMEKIVKKELPELFTIVYPFTTNPVHNQTISL